MCVNIIQAQTVEHMISPIQQHRCLRILENCKIALSIKTENDRNEVNTKIRLDVINR